MAAPPPAPEAAAPAAPAPLAEHVPESFGPLPPARPPEPSRGSGRHVEPAHLPPRRPQALSGADVAPLASTPAPPTVSAAPASTPAPPVSAPPSRAPASTPAPPASASSSRAPASTPSPAATPSSRPPPSVAYRPRRGLVTVPVSSLLGAGGVLIGMVVAAFFVGRASAVPPPRLVARPVLADVPAQARAALPPPPKPCWMVKQPAMWAPRVSRVIPFDVTATRGNALAVGYARDARTAVGIEVTVNTGEIKGRFEEKGDEDIERVVPTAGAEFRVARAGGDASLKSPLEVTEPVPFVVGLAAGAIAVAPTPTGAPVALWPLEGDEALGAAAVHPAGEQGAVLTFRRGGGVFGGAIGADRKAVGPLVKIAGSGGSVGKPAAGWNGHEVAVIFADRPRADGPYEIRVGHGPFGKVPETTAVLPMPAGGPGGDAFAPDIAGLPDGRWLIMWTEGASGSRAVRAQTLTADLAPLGDPIALSPPAGNYGQGAIGITGGYAATVFLSKGATSFELWGAVLQCN
jgi:hypothetical protein